jgi:outer membrane autotransporter protein
VTTWALSPANAGTVQSPIQTDEKGEAKSTLALNSGVNDASLTVCIEGRAGTCKTYAIRSAVSTVIVPATATVNAIAQQAITAPRVQITQIRDRMQQLRNEQSGGFYNGLGIEFPGGRVGTDAATGDSSGEKKTTGGVTIVKPYSAFMLGDVSLSQKKGQTGFDVSTRGLTAGVDYRFSKAWVAGAAIGYSRAITELNIGGEQKASSVSGSVFAQWLPENNTYVSVVANSGRGSYKLSRPTSDLSIANASPKGQSAAVQAEAGYMWSNGGFRLQPFVRGEYAKATIDPIVESGSAEALYIEKQRVRSSTFSAGLVSDYAVSTSMGVFIPSARLEFYRENQRINDNVARLVNGTPVLVELVNDPFDKSYGSFGLNLQWLYGIYGTPISSFVGYEHTFGKTGFKINRFTLGVKIPLR